ncbi:unnamed protein product [Vicia faba]|uniref:Uncharacterized protein n=1 Tax=Vicia faba TaxID=3906 RepID=A0AAV0ZPK6_VICFA|nr:unnamed protein product [Vicia faba]
MMSRRLHEREHVEEDRSNEGDDFLWSLKQRSKEIEVALFASRRGRKFAPIRRVLRVSQLRFQCILTFGFRSCDLTVSTPKLHLWNSKIEDVDYTVMKNENLVVMIVTVEDERRSSSNWPVGFVLKQCEDYGEEVRSNCGISWKTYED